MKGIDSMITLKVILVFHLWLIYFYGCSQTFPISSSLQIAPPYSLSLPDYVALGSEKMVFYAQLNDLSSVQLDIELRVTIEGQGIRIVSLPGANLPVISIIPGINTRLSGLDLEPYFRAENLQFSGLSRQAFINDGGKLPEGIYRFCIDVVEPNRGAFIAATSCATAWLILNDPPVINLPHDNVTLEPSNPQYIRFQWTPRHTGSPNSAFSTEYEFTLVEIWPEGRNPNDAILTTTPLYQTVTSMTSVIYGPSQPALERGRRYAFRVQAKSASNLEGFDLFRNDGFSQVQRFTYGEACVPPENVRIQSSGSRSVNVQWDQALVHTGYLAKYRVSGREDWIEESILFNEWGIQGLQSTTSYEILVSGVCGFTESDPSPILTFTTQAPVKTDFACGNPSEGIDSGNIQPIPSLQPGDIIYIGDFDVSLSEVTGANGIFSGTGELVVPMMNHVKAGAKFENIKVNTDRRVYDGNISLAGITAQILTDQQLEDLDDLFEDVEALDETLDEYGERIEETWNGIEDIVDSESNETSNEDSAITVDSSNSNGSGSADSEATVDANPEENEENADVSDETFSGGSYVDTQEGPGNAGSTGSGGSSGNIGNETEGDEASGDNLEEGEIMLGPVRVVLASAPQSVSGDSEGYCFYENLTAETTLKYEDEELGNGEFLVPNTLVSFKQHCVNKDFKEITLTYESEDHPPGLKIGFIDATLKKFNLAVDAEGNLVGDLDFSAALNEDYTIENVFVIKEGIAGDFNYSFNGSNDFTGKFDLSELGNIEMEMRKDENVLATLSNGAFDEDGLLKGTFLLASEPVAFSHPYGTTTIQHLSLEPTYSFKNGMSFLSGQVSMTLSNLIPFAGEVTIDITYLDDQATATLTSNTLEGFGMTYDDFLLSAAFDKELDLLSLSGTCKAKHEAFDNEVEITDFLYTPQGLQNFNFNGTVGTENYDFIIEECTYDGTEEQLRLDALAKVSVDATEAVVAVSGFTIDRLGNINYDQINVNAKSDLALGPLLIKFNGNVKDSNGGRLEGNPTRAIEGEASVLVKTISGNGNETYKNIEEVAVNYRRYKHEEDGGLIEGSLSWTGSTEFANIQTIKATLTSLSIDIDKEEKLTGGLQFEASLEEDKNIRDVFFLKKGLNGSMAYEFAGKNSFEGTFDLSGLRDIHIVAKKGDVEIASIKNGAFSGDTFSGTFEALPNAKFSSSGFDMELLNLQLTGSYDFSTQTLALHEGNGSLKIEEVQGIEGTLLLAMEYGLDNNINATVTSESDLRGYGFKFQDFNLEADLDTNFDLKEISGSLSAQHDAIDSEINISTFTVKQGKLEMLQASGEIIYQGFNFDLDRCTYTEEQLNFDAQLALNATGTEAKFAVKEFNIPKTGNISVSEVSGELNTGKHLSISFLVGMEDARFKGTFDGELRALGLAISGALDIGKKDNYNFAYLALASQSNIALGATGLKITALGGQVGYNYKLIYKDEEQIFDGEPEKGNYLLGLELGIADVAGLAEVKGNPVIQFGNSSLDLSLKGTLNVTRKKPVISADLRAQYILPDNRLSASFTANMSIPKNSGKFFRANAMMDFTMADNQWSTSGENLSGSLLGAINFDGNFHYSGQVEPFYLNNLALNGRAYFTYNFEYARDFGSASVAISSSATINSQVTADVDKDGLKGELEVTVIGTLDIGVNVIGYDIADVHAALNAAGYVGVEKEKGYIRGEANAQLKLAYFDYTSIPISIDHEFNLY